MFSIVAIRLPFERIFVNVLPNFIIIRLVAYYVVVIGTLKNIISQIPVYKTLQCGYNSRNSGICTGINNISAVINHYQQMNMIWHNNIYWRINAVILPYSFEEGSFNHSGGYGIRPYGCK